jgi:hypothetical protein
MAKAVATTSKNEVATLDENQFTTESTEGLGEGTGAAISHEAADNVVPIVTCLQFLSPQVTASDPRYLEGAKPGDLWLRNHPDLPLIDGEHGFFWQRAAFQRCWIEWIDRERGGGFVARYDDKAGAPDLPGAIRSTENRFDYENPETGNSISMFHNHVGFILGVTQEPLPYLISYKGAGIFESRSWMTSTPPLRIDHKAANGWDFIWRVGSKYKTNNKGKWYDIVPLKRLPGHAKPEQVMLARQLAQQFDTNKIQADMSQATADQQQHAGTNDEVPF